MVVAGISFPPGPQACPRGQMEIFHEYNPIFFSIYLTPLCYYGVEEAGVCPFNVFSHLSESIKMSVWLWQIDSDQAILSSQFILREFYVVVYAAMYTLLSIRKQFDIAIQIDLCWKFSVFHRNW